MHRFWLSLLLLIACAAPASAAVADGVAAAINQRVVALSLLVVYKRAFAADVSWRAALERLIDERLLAIEAGRYGLVIEEPALVRTLVAHPKPTGITQAEWESLWRDHMAARRFLDFRFGEFVPVPREELRAYYQAHRDAYKQPFEEVEDRIRAQLAPQARKLREEAYMAELRARADVRVNPGLLPGE